YAFGYAANRTGEYEIARQALERVLRMGKNEAYTRKELAYSYQSLGDCEAAIPHAQRALSLAEEPDLRAGLHATLAYCYAEVGDRASAVTHGEAAVQADPQDLKSWINLGGLYFEDRKPREALACFERAAALDPEDATSVLWVAECCFDVDDFAG